jgi:hypothetical protein
MTLLYWPFPPKYGMLAESFMLTKPQMPEKLTLLHVMVEQDLRVSPIRTLR